MIRMSTTRAWIALDLLPSIGPRTVRKLLQIYRTPEAVFNAPAAEVSRLGFLNVAQIESIQNGPDEARLEEVMEMLDRSGARAICLDDPAYPDLLRDIHDPPSVLYVRGALDDLQPAVAIVGTRAPSQYGKESAYRMARDLSGCGISIVSGLARGIDKEAHRGALEGISRTVAVLGSGIDVIYPSEHAQIAETIALKGAVISEFPPGTRPDAGNFPRRNRIISGLCQAVIVVEATIRSGAMITARYALDQGRSVMAVPGMITNIRSQGPHQLIRQGATLIQGAEDVVSEIAPQVRNLLNEFKQTTTQTDDILTLISGSPLSIDEIATHLNIDVTEASRRVSMLEIEGTLIRTQGNRYTARSIHG